LARRYAGALFDLALEKTVLPDIHEELLSFLELLNKNQDFRLFFNAQDVSNQQKADVVGKVLDHQASERFRNFLYVLLRKGRAEIYPTVVAEFTRLVDKYNKRIHATTTTAVALDEGLRSRLKSALDSMFSADVGITNNVDPAILGGIIVQVEGRILDGSLQNQLQRLKKSMIESGHESLN
jgi:F-type H+-transporting ATPase subunit delta